MSPSKVDNSGNIGVSVFWEQRWAAARKWTTTKLDTLFDPFDVSDFIYENVRYYFHVFVYKSRKMLITRNEDDNFVDLIKAVPKRYLRLHA